MCGEYNSPDIHLEEVYEGMFDITDGYDDSDYPDDEDIYDESGNYDQLVPESHTTTFESETDILDEERKALELTQIGLMI